MTPKHIAAYADYRRAIFDPKGDCEPLCFALPEATLLKAASSIGRAQDLVPLPGGTFYTCFRFDTANGSYVLRIPTNEQLAPSLLVEDWAAKAAQEVHFPALVPLITDTSHYLAPFSFQILPYVEGPSSAMRMGRIARLHQVSVAGYGPLNPVDVTKGRRPTGLHDTWSSYLTTCLDTHLAECVKINAMTGAEAERVDDLIRGFNARFDPVLLHNDLSDSNIVAEQVLDWESAIAGDPVWDFASYYAFHADQEILWESFHVKDPDLCRRFWTYYLRIALSRTVHRARAMIPEHRAYPKASARIQLALGNLS